MASLWPNIKWQVTFVQLVFCNEYFLDTKISIFKRNIKKVWKYKFVVWARLWTFLLVWIFAHNSPTFPLYFCNWYPFCKNKILNVSNFRTCNCFWRHFSWQEGSYCVLLFKMCRALHFVVTGMISLLCQRLRWMLLPCMLKVNLTWFQLCCTLLRHFYSYFGLVLKVHGNMDNRDECMDGLKLFERVKMEENKANCGIQTGLIIVNILSQIVMISRISRTLVTDISSFPVCLFYFSELII